MRSHLALFMTANIKFRVKSRVWEFFMSILQTMNNSDMFCVLCCTNVLLCEIIDSLLKELMNSCLSLLHTLQRHWHVDNYLFTFHLCYINFCFQLQPLGFFNAPHPNR